MPVVLRPSRSLWACAASEREYAPPIRTSRVLLPTQERTLSPRHRSSSRVAVYQARAGLVRKRLPYLFRVRISNGGTGPLEAPKSTM